MMRELLDNESIDLAFNRQKHAGNLPLVQRRKHLISLRNWIHANRGTIHEAMYADFKKPATEVDGTELFHVLNEIKFALFNLETWVKPLKVDAPLTLLGTKSLIQYEPRGVCLIISPWNYPFSLCIGPLVSALAAGNRVIIKPSELTTQVSALLKNMAGDIFQADEVSVFEGGPEVSQQLLKLPFDHIFFTGSPAIGKEVMKAAAENLASVTLELGGKTPTIVTASANIKDAAQRIVVGKFINNGQTCVAPDYILVDETVEAAFTTELITQLKNLFTENEESFSTSKHYARIVNEKHFLRLQNLLQDAVDKGAELVYAGENDHATNFFHPTIIRQVRDDARLLTEEIFGPILPVLHYKIVEEVILFVNSKPKPLALYIFTNENKVQEKIMTQTSSGAVCINDCAIHFLNHNLPFGGVNNSGIGKSHGYYGFLAFSNEKAIMKQRSGFTSVRAFYPPYSPFKQKLMNLFLKFF